MSLIEFSDEWDPWKPSYMVDPDGNMRISIPEETLKQMLKERKFWLCLPRGK